MSRGINPFLMGGLDDFGGLENLQFAGLENLQFGAEGDPGFAAPIGAVPYGMTMAGVPYGMTMGALVPGDPLFGANPYAEFGAHRRPRPGHHPAPHRHPQFAYPVPIAPPAPPHLTAAEQVELRRGEDFPFGLDSGATLIAVGASLNVTALPQKRTIPNRVTVSQFVADNFLISNFTIGVDPVFASTSPISASLFVQNSTAPNFRAVICEVGMTISMTVTNIGLAAARFIATVIGRQLPPA